MVVRVYGDCRRCGRNRVLHPAKNTPANEPDPEQFCDDCISRGVAVWYPEKEPGWLMTTIMVIIFILFQVFLFTAIAGWFDIAARSSPFVR